MPPIDPHEYQKRLDAVSGILGKIAEHAQTQALTRCPYKNRFNECTAQFGCRYQRPSASGGELLQCTSDDRLDYRSAWESDPGAESKMRQQLVAQRKSVSPPGETAGQSNFDVCHGDRACPAESGRSLFEHADRLNVRIPSSCGRTGHCHECVVEIRRGMSGLSERSRAEQFLKENYRLACQSVIAASVEDIEFSLLRRTPQILIADKSSVPGELSPMVTRQENDVYYGTERIDSYRGHIWGWAIDLGTTTVVAELIDLESGETVYATAFENPQRFGGSDIMNRISYDGGPHQGELHRSIINTLNTEISLACEKLGVDRHAIYELVVVGNSTMRELFFGRDVQPIGQKPYKSSVELEYREGKRESTALIELARSLRIRANKNARVFGAPLIASHVGGDVVADLVALDLASQSGTFMLVDAGTNTEVVVGTRDRMLTASCPAGPAFEGGLVRFGMPGCEGAIESLSLEGDRFAYRTIGNTSPRGICGSGLIAFLAEVRRHGWMNEKGKFTDKRREIPVVPELGIGISLADVSHLAQAKAANYCGQQILLRHLGLRPDDIQRLYLAGGFANYVDPSDAIEIGFLAPVPPGRIVRMGNAASQGARMMLLSRRQRESIERLITKIEHVELETTPDFFDIFVDGCQLQPMQVTASHGPSQ